MNTYKDSFFFKGNINFTNNINNEIAAITIYKILSQGSTATLKP